MKPLIIIEIPAVTEDQQKRLSDSISNEVRKDFNFMFLSNPINKKVSLTLISDKDSLSIEKIKE